MNIKIISFSVFVIALVVVLAVVGTKNNQQNMVVSETGATIPCLPNGHQQVAQHIHPTLSITVNGEPETVPANLGIEGACMREVHTHDETGTIHIETALPNKNYVLADFFAIWGQNMDREGYDMKVSQNGEVIEAPAELILVDHASISIEYTTQVN